MSATSSQAPRHSQQQPGNTDIDTSSTAAAAEHPGRSCHILHALKHFYFIRQQIEEPYGNTVPIDGGIRSSAPTASVPLSYPVSDFDFGSIERFDAEVARCKLFVKPPQPYEACIFFHERGELCGGGSFRLAFRLAVGGECTHEGDAFAVDHAR